MDVIRNIEKFNDDLVKLKQDIKNNINKFNATNISKNKIL